MIEDWISQTLLCHAQADKVTDIKKVSNEKLLWIEHQDKLLELLGQSKRRVLITGSDLCTLQRYANKIKSEQTKKVILDLKEGTNSV